jgi:hexosaminidase
MKHTFHTLSTILAIGLTLASCSSKNETLDLTQNTVIPRPVSVVATHGVFTLQEDTKILLGDASEELQTTGAYLTSVLRPATGFDFAVEAKGAEMKKGHIFLTLDPAFEPAHEEAYQISIETTGIHMVASQPQGIFRAIQTLRQLLPAAIEHSSVQMQKWQVGTGVITDRPEYPFRSAMLDVSRHFFEVSAVKRYIDQLALYKINTLHLHLTDDQGWRIEIKSWPNLTKHGGSTQVGGGKGGFYTQEDYRDLVDYAANRYITIIPEVDMPGHTNAALASYPELNCDGIAPDLYTGIEVGFSTLCTSKEIVYQFVDDVVREIAALTPGPWLHVGGDESLSTELEDYQFFINRTRTIVESHGKKMIGWDEVAHADIDENVLVQFWDKQENALEGIAKGARLIVSPANYTYMDMKYDSTTVLGLKWAGYTEVDEAYSWDPTNLAEGITRAHIFGVEAPLWSETIETSEDLEYLAFPRLPGHAEIGWTAPNSRNWEEYRQRLASHGERMTLMGIHFYQSPLVDWP